MVEYHYVIVVMLLGSIAYTLMNYYTKKCQGKIEYFDVKYAYQLAGKAVVDFVLSLPIYLAFKIDDTLSDPWILLIAFVFGYGGLPLVEEIKELYDVKNLKLIRRVLEWLKQLK